MMMMMMVVARAARPAPHDCGVGLVLDTAGACGVINIHPGLVIFATLSPDFLPGDATCQSIN